MNTSLTFIQCNCYNKARIETTNKIQNWREFPLIPLYLHSGTLFLYAEDGIYVIITMGLDRGRKRWQRSSLLRQTHEKRYATLNVTADRLEMFFVIL